MAYKFQIGKAVLQGSLTTTDDVGTDAGGGSDIQCANAVANDGSAFIEGVCSVSGDGYYVSAVPAAASAIIAAGHKSNAASCKVKIETLTKGAAELYAYNATGIAAKMGVATAAGALSTNDALAGASFIELKASNASTSTFRANANGGLLHLASDVTLDLANKTTIMKVVGATTAAQLTITGTGAKLLKLQSDNTLFGSAFLTVDSLQNVPANDEYTAQLAIAEVARIVHTKSATLGRNVEFSKSYSSGGLTAGIPTHGAKLKADMWIGNGSKSTGVAGNSPCIPFANSGNVRAASWTVAASDRSKLNLINAVGVPYDVATNAGSFVVGREYKITTAGDTDFTLIGAANSSVNTIFVATGTGSGSGAAASGDTVITLPNIGTGTATDGAIYRFKDTSASTHRRQYVLTPHSSDFIDSHDELGVAQSASDTLTIKGHRIAFSLVVDATRNRWLIV